MTGRDTAEVFCKECGRRARVPWARRYDTVHMCGDMWPTVWHPLQMTWVLACPVWHWQFMREVVRSVREL